MISPDQNKSAAPSLVSSSIAAWLSVQDSEKAIEFYKAAFNATEAYRLDTPDGPIVKLSVERAEFWVSPEGETQNNLGGGSIRMIVTVADPDSLFKRAINAGAVEISAIHEGHGWRIGRIVDPFGLHWEIGRPI